MKGKKEKNDKKEIIEANNKIDKYENDIKRLKHEITEKELKEKDLINNLNDYKNEINELNNAILEIKKELEKEKKDYNNKLNKQNEIFGNKELFK